MPSIDIVAICNALIDIHMQVTEEDLKQLNLNKGVMHLVDAERQKYLFSHFHSKKHSFELGGSALNVLRVVAAMGARTSFAGMIGTDENGKRIHERMRTLGIEATLHDISEPTGTCVVLVTPDGERTMNTCLGASRLYDERVVPHKHIEKSRILHFCGYQWDTDGQRSAIYKALETAKKKDVLVSFDVADPFVVDRNTDEFKTIIRDHADIVFANEREVHALYGTTPESAAREIAKQGAIAAIKLGAKGAVIARGKDLFHIPAQPTTVVDTTAAGDCFAGGFLYGVLQGHEPDICGKIAATLAADVISRLGTTVSTQTLKAVRNDFAKRT